MCSITVTLCSVKGAGAAVGALPPQASPWEILDEGITGAAHRPLVSGHAVGMSHHLGALDSRPQHAPLSSC